MCSPEVLRRLGASRAASEGCLDRRTVRGLARAVLGSRAASSLRSHGDARAALEEEFAGRCGAGDQLCWAESAHRDGRASGRLLARARAAHRPRAPASWLKKPLAWLGNKSIQSVMMQYEAAYPDFRYLNTLPSDFDKNAGDGRCVSALYGYKSPPDMCAGPSRDALASSLVGRRCAAVLNLDTHDKSGSHWVAVFADLRPESRLFGVYFYDSAARLRGPPESVRRLASLLRRAVRDRAGPRAARRLRFRANTSQVQRGKSECGVYAMLFVSQMLRGDRTFGELCRAMPSDEDTAKLRAAFFAPPRAKEDAPRTAPGRRVRGPRAPGGAP